MKAAVFLCVWAISSAWPNAAAPPAPLTGEEIQIKTSDGWTLKAAYLAAKSEQKTFLLLHGTGQRKELWQPLAAALKRLGYGYLAVDFRGHGASTLGPDNQELSWRKFKLAKNENQFENMSRDVEAAFAYLSSQNVSESSIGIIGADVGSSIGIKYAAVHNKVPMMIMLSPGLSYQEVLTVNAMRAYARRPILMIYGQDDRYSMRATPLLYGFARLSAGEENATVLAVPREHGLAMFKRSRGLAGQILDWIENPVKPAVGISSSSAPADTKPQEPAEIKQDLE